MCDEFNDLSSDEKKLISGGVITVGHSSLFIQKQGVWSGGVMEQPVVTLHPVHPTNMQIYAHQKSESSREVTIKPENAGAKNSHKKSMQQSQWRAELCGQWRDLEEEGPGVGLPAARTRLNRTDYGLRPFRMVAQKRQKLLQQNCPCKPYLVR